MNLGKTVALGMAPGTVDKILSEFKNGLDVDLTMEFFLTEIIWRIN